MIEKTIQKIPHELSAREAAPGIHPQTTSRFSSSLKVGLLAALFAVATALPVGASATGWSQQHQASHSQKVRARVLNVKPIYRQVRVQEPRRQCWTEYRQHDTLYEGPSQQIRHRQNSPYRGNDYRVKRNRRGNDAAPLVGALVGGVIGNRIGRATGSPRVRAGATIAGAVIGTVIGNGSSSNWQSTTHKRDRFNSHRLTNRQHQNQQHRQSRRHNGKYGKRHGHGIERCATRNVTSIRDELQGYQVAYSYQGKTYTTRTRRRPGSHILLQINLQPLHRH